MQDSLSSLPFLGEVWKIFFMLWQMEGKYGVALFLLIAFHLIALFVLAICCFLISTCLRYARKEARAQVLLWRNLRQLGLFSVKIQGQKTGRWYTITRQGTVYMDGVVRFCAYLQDDGEPYTHGKANPDADNMLGLALYIKYHESWFIHKANAIGTSSNLGRYQEIIRETFGRYLNFH